MLTITITINPCDLGEKGVDITDAEFDRCTDLIVDALNDAGIWHAQGRFTASEWSFDIRESDKDAVGEIIGKAIEGSFGQWTDAANEDA